MLIRPLGNAGDIPAMGFGCMGLVGWYGERDDDEAKRTLEHAIEVGVTHFDTASSYQNGENERFVGDIIREHRDHLFLASKYGISRLESGGLAIDNKPESLRAAVDGSLQRLGTEYIDLYYLHRIDQTVPIEESVGMLAALITAGKIRYIGLSECSAETLRRAHSVHPIAAVQSEYSLWTRDPERDGVLNACRDLKIGFVAYSPLGRGFLAGNFNQLTDLPPKDHRQTHPRFQPENIEQNRRIKEVIDAFAEQKNCSSAQLAIAWVLSQGNNIHVIPGTKRRTRLDDNVGALDVAMTKDEGDALAARIAEIGVRGDRQPPAMMKVLRG